ncbi:McrB family protein [Guptibacillus spartinae]|uniref:McrB family protein n=1 Tax=Guptibacillus spartinae TaxID=3025679 RepID=UPI0023622DC1|nr:AAA family ATPase [Pseudalkalibacillus spartinae]
MFDLLYNLYIQHKKIYTLENNKPNYLKPSGNQGILVKTQEENSQWKLVSKNIILSATIDLLTHKKIFRNDLKKYGRTSFLHSLLAQLPFIKVERNNDKSVVSLIEYTTEELPEAQFNQVVIFLDEIIAGKYNPQRISSQISEDSKKRLKSRARQGLKILGFLDSSFNMNEERLRKYEQANSKVSLIRDGILKHRYFKLILELLRSSNSFTKEEKLDSLVELGMHIVRNSQGENLMKESVAKYRTRNILSWLEEVNLINSDWNVIDSSSFIHKKDEFQRLRQDTFHSVIIKLRKERAKQLRKLLDSKNHISYDAFNNEVWNLGHAVLNGEKVDIFEALSIRNHTILNQLESELENGSLKYLGNSIWGSGSRVFGSGITSLSVNEKESIIRDAVQLLNDEGMQPIEKAERIASLKGFGENSATGLVMVFHPDEFGIYNVRSKEALNKLGYEHHDLESFHQQLSNLKNDVDADDYIELDWFLYWISLDTGEDHGDHQYWWVNQGQTHRSEKQGGFLWAPKQNKQGRPLKHHVDLLEAKVEDPIFTYSSGEVKTVAIVREPTISQAQPDTISNGMWEKEGYYTSVDYYDLSPPIEKAEVPEKWRIEEEGPFDRNGNVKQGYFFNVTDDFATNLFHRFKERFPEEVHSYFEGKGEIVEMTDSELVSHIDSYIASKGFYYEKEEVENLFLSLKTKPFVILSGISGTGKTKIVQWFAESVGATEKNSQFTLIPVRPDWSDGSDLLGYVDIKGEFQEGPLTRVIREASIHRNKPYFVLLDEMNLARVEYYFSDILSVMESKRLENGELVTSSILPEETIGEHLGIPENLYFIGTVNMDETTHPFSKKVLDRANTIEFNRVNLNNFAFLENDDEIENLEIQNQTLSGEFLHLKDAYEGNQDLVHRATDLLVEVNRILEQIGAHVGYRVRDEVCFYCIYNDQAGLMTFNHAFDYQLLQKILPRLAGSDARVLRVLEDLYTFTSGKRVSDDQLENLVESAKQAAYPKSAHKLLEMIRRFRDDGFTSFWT